MTLLLAVLQTSALVIFQHTVLAAELALAERAVTNDLLGCFFAVFERALGLLRCASADRERKI